MAILESIEEGDLASVIEILENGYDLDSEEDEEGMTSLMLASSCGYLPIVAVLINKGANANRLDIYGNSALYYAARDEQWEIFEYLYLLTSEDIKQWHFIAAVGNEEFSVLEAFLRSGIDIDVCRQKGVWSENGLTPLMIAVQQENPEIVQKLLEHNPDLDLIEEDTGKSALIFALESGNQNIIQLIQSKA
jgi:uncharacterized protein